jgi:hypothetical protein
MALFFANSGDFMGIKSRAVLGVALGAMLSIHALAAPGAALGAGERGDLQRILGLAEKGETEKPVYTLER